MPKVLFATLTTSRYNYGSALAELSDTIDSLEQIVILEDISSSQRLLPLQPGYLRYDEILERGSRNTIEIDNLERRIKSDAILNLQFTSGSTGAPKAAALTHRGMLNSARYIGLQMSVSHQDKIVIPVPLFHAFGLVMGVCCALVQGATIVLPSEYFDAAATLQAVDRLQCTGLYGVTTMFIDEMSHRQFLKTKRSTLRFGIMAGSAMPEELLSRVMSTFPIPALFTNWGMTELSSVATMTTATDPVSKKMKTAGRLLPNFVAKIVEPDTGRVLPWGQRGEIVVSGFGVMHSYYGNPEQTRKTIQVHEEDLLPNQAGADAQGRLRRWMHTGDEGYLDEEGYFVITGRIKDLIIRGGENISPLEIESRLYDHPAIKQAVVFGVPNERYGEAVAAMLELQDGREVRPSDQEIKAWVRASLSRYKVPVHIWWLGDQDSGDPKPVAKDRQREAEKT
ncbi:hypothetical protein H2200_005584 [Cladophialophora chaetospira]|uniref:Uncharacterized protein n=1 Tax=Cladophialophora chaetospira TaxID=386627 RepID=A0AA38XCH3_9EURO|nr:hypothetical protein H2200_005584 [Cladophialophora chaetospira]